MTTYIEKKRVEASMSERTKLIVDDTSIYEVDLDCFDCLSEEERWRYYGEMYPGKLKEEEKGAAE